MDSTNVSEGVAVTSVVSSSIMDTTNVSEGVVLTSDKKR